MVLQPLNHPWKSTCGCEKYKPGWGTWKFLFAPKALAEEVLLVCRLKFLEYTPDGVFIPSGHALKKQDKGKRPTNVGKKHVFLKKTF